MNNRLKCASLVGLLLGCFAGGHAQDVSTSPLPPALRRLGPGVTVAQKGNESGIGFQFVSGEPAISGQGAQAVKGAPYSLDATIETVQILADGNRIAHRRTVHLCRDSKGRTRREETLAAIGPWAASGPPPTLITIQDPISGVSYFLDPQKKTASKIPTPPAGKAIRVTGGGMAGGEAGDGPVITNTGPVPPEGGFVVAGEGHILGFNAGKPGEVSRPAEKSQSLGQEIILALVAEGTRTTTTIPADAIGNERPLEIVRDRWYSPDLQIVLKSKQTDPRFGDTTYDVTNLEREEPSASLFKVPAGYTVRP
jgi:hypothetical protein